MSEIRVLITDSHGQSRHLDLRGTGFTVGRQADADVVLEHPAVSRHHAEIFCDPFGRWWIRDLASRHGIFVNDQRVDDRIVTERDRVRIGKFSLRLANAEHEPETADFPSVPVLDDPGIDGTSLETFAPSDQVGRRLKTLVELSTQLGTLHDAAERRQLVCNTVAEEIPGSTTMLLRMSSDGQQPHELARAGRSDDIHVSRTLLRTMAEERQALVASNVSTGVADVEISIAYAQQPLAALACPLEVHADGFDLIYVSTTPEHASSEWLSFVSMAATIFQQSESSRRLHEQLKEHDLIEHDLERARRMQQRLTPSEVDCPGLDVALGFEPCRWVGGDYVDVVTSPNGQRTLLIADVCGKGLPAAMVTGNLHAAVHAALAQHASLTALFTDLNRYLNDTLRGDSFVTMLAVQIEPGSGHCTALSAGHPVPVAIDGAGNLSRWEMTVTPPLGLFEQEYKPYEIRQQPGDWLIAYTDGAIEIANEQRERLWEEGLDRILLEAVADEPSAAQLMERINARLDAFQGRAVPVDDRTLMVARLS